MEPEIIQAILRRAFELAQTDGSLGAATARHWLQAKHELVGYCEPPRDLRCDAPAH